MQNWDYYQRFKKTYVPFFLYPNTRAWSKQRSLGQVFMIWLKDILTRSTCPRALLICCLLGEFFLSAVSEENLLCKIKRTKSCKPKNHMHAKFEIIIKDSRKLTWHSSNIQTWGHGLNFFYWGRCLWSG